MYKKIKKQIKRSLPVFMIINLIISTIVAGLVFNYDFKISNSITKDLRLLMNKPTALADMATTTVTVKNAPPSFTTDPAENPGSTSTSPVNIGSTIGFTATAHDPELQNYHLIVCSTNSVNPVDNNQPTCAATTFCVSGSTADNAEASCTYSNVTDPGSELKDWYAFVCDRHLTEADCSLASQGSNPGILATSSPIYINHSPSFDALGTITNFQDPGGAFTVEASSTDLDVMRGPEILHLYVCQTASWATSTGCAIQLCHATSTSPDISCSFATSTPAVDGSYTYYGYVMDYFSATTTPGSRSSTYTVNNVAPVINNLTIEGGDDIQLNIKNAPQKAASTTSTSITDNNGCTDIVSATSTLYWSSVAGGDNCTADDNNCYKIASANCVQVPGSCTGPDDINVSYICTTSMAHYAKPTDESAGNTASSTYWLAGMTARDELLYGNVIATNTVDVLTTTALDVSESDIAYGIVRAGLNTGTSTATTTVINFGNSPLNAYLYGTDMVSGGNTIDIHWQQHGLTAYFNYGDGTYSTSTPPGDLENTDINRPTSLTNVLDNIYWGISIPFGTLSGDYEGHNTFTAALDGSGVGW